jgi:hypothetical protein
VGNRKPRFDIDAWLQSLHEISTVRDSARLVEALKQMVIDYSPSAYLLQQIAEEQRSTPRQAPSLDPTLQA